MKRYWRGLLLALVLLCASGCSLLGERSYLYTQEHDEQYEADATADALTVDNYYGLRNAILSLVESGTESGIIRSYSYDGDITEDLDAAAYEITRSDPVGAYAVDYMTHTCNRIVSYYEIQISITFRRSAADIASIVRVSGLSEAESLLVAAVEAQQSVLTLRLSYTSDLDAQQVLAEACLANPLLRIGDPEVSMQIYPETGVQRIVELNFSYSESEAAIAYKQSQVAAVVENLSHYVFNADNDRSYLATFYRRLRLRCAYDPENLDGDVYDALVNCSAGSRGIAEAFYLLCEQQELACSIVSGKKNGEAHWWNIVVLDGQSYHVDETAAIEANNSTLNLWYDEDIYASYAWDTALYPACTKPEEPEEEQEEMPEEISEEALETGLPEDPEESLDESPDESPEENLEESPDESPEGEAAPEPAETEAETEPENQTENQTEN